MGFLDSSESVTVAQRRGMGISSTPSFWLSLDHLKGAGLSPVAAFEIAQGGVDT